MGNYLNFFTYFPYKKNWDKNKGENNTRSSKMSGRFLEISDRLAARAETYHRRKLRENASFRNPAVSNISRGSVSHYGYPSHYHTESHHDQKQDDPYMSMDNFTNYRSYGWKFHFYGIICHVPTKGRCDFNEQSYNGATSFLWQYSFYAHVFHIVSKSL